MNKYICCLLALCAGINSGLPLLAAEAVASGTSPSSSRLPSSIEPQSYQMRIEPDLGHSTFQGSETVLIDITQSSPQIVLNAAELKITGASLQAISTAETIKVQTTLDAPMEQLHIVPGRALAPGKYKLQLSFSGILNDKLRGFYRSRYKDAAGRVHTLAATQMEATDARRMFPCFDEPAFKATYKITTIIEPALTAISNAPVLTDTSDPSTHKRTIVFAETPRMSTYLVALMVGQFEATPPLVVAGIPIRVWSVPGRRSSRQYAQKTAAAILPFYNAYFGIPYPAAKLDLIAIPDFEAGAMENLGAITFRETALLADPKTASNRTRQRVASIIAHEMAHMWFGDLVTMKWWDDLWLNEAFATWMSYKAVDHIRPDWHPWDQFAAERAYSMSTDSLQSSHPIHCSVANPSQANEMFDEITYQKGASILRMLEKFVGEKLFQEGIDNYLNKFKFSNAQTEDFWAAIAAASKLPIPEIMHGWVYQTGYPVISLGAHSATLDLTQQRFLLDKSTTTSNINDWWQIPMTFRSLESEDKSSEPTAVLFNHPQQAVNEMTAPFLCNAGGNGYFRVHYQPEMFKALLPFIPSSMTAPERLMLLSDTWALALSGQVAIDEYLQLTTSYEKEQDPTVMSSLIGNLGYLGRFVSVHDRPYFQRFVVSLLTCQKQKLGWKASPGEGDLVAMLRGKVLDALGTYGGDQSTIAEARKQYAKYLHSPTSVDPNLLDSIIDIVAFNGNVSDYQKIKKDWLAARTPESEERNFLALGAFRKPELTARTLPLCLSSEVRTQDAPHLLSRLLSNESTKYTSWQFVKKNWNVILKKYSPNMIPHLVTSVSAMTEPKDLLDFKTFFKTHPLENGKKSIAQTIERLKINVNFSKRNAKILSSFLEQNYH